MLNNLLTTVIQLWHAKNTPFCPKNTFFATLHWNEIRIRNNKLTLFLKCNIDSCRCKVYVSEFALYYKKKDRKKNPHKIQIQWHLGTSIQIQTSIYVSRNVTHFLRLHLNGTSFFPRQNWWSVARNCSEECNFYLLLRWTMDFRKKAQLLLQLIFSNLPQKVTI